MAAGFFFELEKGSNWLPKAIGQQLLAIVIFVPRYFKSGASAAPRGDLLGWMRPFQLESD
jgi:hypothetical protein